MWKQHRAFVLADSVVALFLISMVAVWICLSQVQLVSQMNHARQEAQLARLAKEASDQYAIDHQNQHLQKDGYHIIVNQTGVQILKNQHLKFTVKRNE
ncbi:hypothetical protein [Paucilactobacillus sp. N302-9]